MKRAPIVLTGTALGLVGVISYHTTPSTTTGLTAGSSSAASATTSSGSTPASSSGSTHSASAATTTTTTTAAATTTTSQPAATTRTATGEDVSYQYGDVEVKITTRGGKITAATLVRLDVTDPRSQQIDEYAIPQLQQQTLSAQSAHIDGVSGATYTSEAYAQSLQSAIDKLRS